MRSLKLDNHSILYSAITILIIGTLTSSCFFGESKYTAIRVKGSDSEVNLVQALAESYMDTDSLVSIGVTGGGSGTGISALINGKTDLANSSRTITKEELYYAEKRNVHPYSIIFAQDALAIIINENNPINKLSLSQLSKLYSGKIQNWKEVGGLDEKISLYGRQSSSGTFIYFREYIVQDEYNSSMIGMSGTAQIVEAIKADEKGIGYVSSGYLDDAVMQNLKVVEIQKDESSKSYTPMEKNTIKSGEYPIIRPLYQYTNGKPTGELLKFILFQIGPVGTNIIESSGFYTVNEDKLRKELTGK